jgi:hypothetical protein
MGQMNISKGELQPKKRFRTRLKKRKIMKSNCHKKTPQNRIRNFKAESVES